MFTLRQRIFTISGVTIAIVLIIVLGLIYRSKHVDPNEIISDTEVSDVDISETGSEEFFEQPPVELPSDVDPDELLAKQVARIFVERFTTYSNQNDNAHIADALELSTESMQQWIKTQTLNKSNEYQGVTTRVLSNSVASIDDVNAVIKIAVQQEQRSATESVIVQKTGRVELTKAGETWLVQGLFWDK